jgi:hypothetical protein
LEKIRKALIAANLPLAEQSLRRPNQKPTRELYQAYLFAGSYGAAFDYRGMQIEMAPEYCEHDVRLRWPAGASFDEALVQLKEMPPARLNESLTLGDLVQKVSRKYHHASNLTMAFFLNRTARFGTVQTPIGHFRDLWFYGFNAENRLTLFLMGVDRHGIEHRFTDLPSGVRKQPTPRTSA